MVLMVLVFREKEDGDEIAAHRHRSVTSEWLFITIVTDDINNNALTVSVEGVCVCVHHGGVLAAGDHQSHFLSGAQSFLPLLRQLPNEIKHSDECLYFTSLLLLL